MHSGTQWLLDTFWPAWLGGWKVPWTSLSCKKTKTVDFHLFVGSCQPQFSTPTSLLASLVWKYVRHSKAQKIAFERPFKSSQQLWAGRVSEPGRWKPLSGQGPVNASESDASTLRLWSWRCLDVPTGVHISVHIHHSKSWGKIDRFHLHFNDQWLMLVLQQQILRCQPSYTSGGSRGETKGFCRAVIAPAVPSNSRTMWSCISHIHTYTYTYIIYTYTPKVQITAV